jgi:hypothetical protein
VQQEQQRPQDHQQEQQHLGAGSPPKQPSDFSGGDHTLHLAPVALVSSDAVQSPYHRPLAAIAIKQEQPSPRHHQQEPQQNGQPTSAAAAAAAAATAAAAGADGDLTPACMSFADALPSQRRQQEPPGQQEEVQGSAGLSLQELPAAETLASDADGVYVAMSRLLTLIGNTGSWGRRAAACRNVATGVSCLLNSSQLTMV